MRNRVDRHLRAVQPLSFPFAFDTPGLTDGVEVYTPTVGDRLMEAWFEIDTAWDGTTPLADIGTFAGAPTGLFLWPYSAVPLDLLADEEQTGAGMDFAFTQTLSGSYVMGAAAQSTVSGANIIPPALPVSNNGNGIIRFTATHPLKVAVSRDGTAGGADPGATKGAATLHLLLLLA